MKPKGLLIFFVVAAGVSPVTAQEMDWGSIMQAEAQGSAVREAGQDIGQRPSRPNRFATPEMKRTCADGRARASAGRKPPKWDMLLFRCLQAGY